MNQQSQAEHHHERQRIPKALRLAVLVTMLVALMTGASVLLASPLARSDSGGGDSRSGGVRRSTARQQY